MASNEFSIPWQPLDISPGAAMIIAANNSSRQHARADEYLNLQRQAMANSAERASHELERDKEREERRRAIETWNAMPMLQRAAMRSIGMANTNPYGVRFDESRDLPANVEGPQVSPEAEAARFAPPKAGVRRPTLAAQAIPSQEAGGDRVVGQVNGLPLVDPAFQLHPDEEGPEQFPGPEEDRFFLAEQRNHRTTVAPMVPVQADSLDALGDAERRAIAENITSVGNRTTLATPNLTGRTAAESDPLPSLNEPTTADVPRELAPQTPDAEIPQDMPRELPLMMQAATNSFAPGPEGKRRIFATYQGNRFEVPEQSEKTPFGPEYDVIYRGLVEAGEAPHDALKMVATQYKADQTQENIARRTAANTAALIRGRDVSREDTQRFQAEQDAKYRRTFDQAMKLARAAAVRVDPSGGASPAVMEQLTRYALDNPGDQPGLYRLAGTLKAPGKAVASAIGQTEATQGQTADALRAKQGLRAAESMQKSGYVPTREDTQKWLNNQRWVYASKKDSVTGLFVLGGQSAKFLPQSEVEGLSPEGQEYFANVRRLMEPLGRAASGAAINEGEWVNFYNQYGPNSSGGLAAAIRDLQDRFKLSGTAGQSLGEGSTQAPRSGGGSSSALRAKAERALSDPNAPPEAKAAARKILGR